MARLDGKVALVTGASRGIGRATALALAAEGARVLIHYRTSCEAARAVADEIIGRGGNADVLDADLATPRGATTLAARVRELIPNHLDIFVSNAGITKAASMESHTVEDFDTLVATNVRAPFFLLQQLLPVLRNGSSVIVITSQAAKFSTGSDLDGAPSIPAYAATKGALETLVKHWAARFGVYGIRVNSVAPGVIETELSSFTNSEALREATLKMQALKQIGQPQDVADAVVFLASDRSRLITGASIPVDGGLKL